MDRGQAPGLATQETERPPSGGGQGGRAWCGREGARFRQAPSQECCLPLKANERGGGGNMWGSGRFRLICFGDRILKKCPTYVESYVLSKSCILSAINSTLWC